MKKEETGEACGTYRRHETKLMTNTTKSHHINSHGITQQWCGSHCHEPIYHITFFSLPIHNSPKNFKIIWTCIVTIFVNKTNRCTEFQFYWYYDSTCFGQSFCPSSGVLSCTLVLVHFMQIWWLFAIRSITFFSLPIQYSPKNVIFFLEFPISCSPLLLLQTACYFFLHALFMDLSGHYPCSLPV
jgi:hypothetical protein